MHVANIGTPGRTITKIAGDLLGHVVGGDVDVLETRLEKLTEQSFQNRFVPHLEHGLGAAVGERA
ncbi:hypothetical protein D3C86_2063710 [compost metagenome]